MAGKRSLDDYPRQITATDAALWLNDRLGREVRFTMCRPHRALLAVSDRLMAWPPEEALSGRPGWSIGGHGMLELRLDDLPGCRVDLDLSPEEWDVNGEEVEVEVLVIELGDDVSLSVHESQDVFARDGGE